MPVFIRLKRYLSLHYSFPNRLKFVTAITKTPLTGKKLIAKNAMTREFAKINQLILISASGFCECKRVNEWNFFGRNFSFMISLGEPFTAYLMLQEVHVGESGLMFYSYHYHQTKNLTFSFKL